MAVRIGSNSGSLGTVRRLGEATARLNTAAQRLSSGLRINRASDDPAGLSIASRLQADSRIIAQGIRNLNDGVSLLAIAEGAMTELSSIAQRQLELAEQASNGVYSDKQRKALHLEAKSLTDEFNRIVSSTEFNNLKLLDPNLGTITLHDGTSPIGIDLTLTGEFDRNVSNGTYTAVQTFGGTFSISENAVDIDGDGIMDLLGGTGNLVVYKGVGDGTFTASGTYALGFIYNRSLTDLNNDGKLDVVFSDYINNQIGSLLGNGDGTFKAVSTIAATSSGTRALAVGDVNGDGFADAIAGGYYDNNVDVMLGNGDGTFHIAMSTTTTGPKFTLNLGDLNGDGKLDIVMPNGGAVGVMFGNGNGTFTAPITVTGSGDITARTELGDFNNDGILDILRSGGAGGTTSTLVALGNGNGTFKAEVTAGTSAGQNAQYTVMDFSGDGIDDIAVANFDNNILSILVGNGDGTFRTATSFATGASPRIVAGGDFNGDGSIDISWHEAGPGTLIVALSQNTQVTTEQYVDLTTRENALASIGTLRSTLNRISTGLGAVGAQQSRLSFAVSRDEILRLSYLDAASRITDADIAEESANFVREKIVQQAAAAILAKSNLEPALALTLLGTGKGRR